MTALAATDVVITLPVQDVDISRGAKVISLPTIAFGDGALTYPTGGVPLPAIGKFGMKRQLQRLFLQAPLNGMVYRYDPTNHKLKIYTQGFVTGSTAAAAAEDGALVENSLGVEGTPRIPNTLKDITYDMGQLIELPVTIAPVAVSIPAMVVGE